MRYRISVPPEAMTPELVKRAWAVTDGMRDELSMALAHVTSGRHKKRLIECAAALLQGRLNALIKASAGGGN
jgi:hypothetical protein